MEVPWIGTLLTQIKGVYRLGQTSFDRGRHLVSYKFLTSHVKQARLSLSLHVCIFMFFYFTF